MLLVMAHKGLQHYNELIRYVAKTGPMEALSGWSGNKPDNVSEIVMSV